MAGNANTLYWNYVKYHVWHTYLGNHFVLVFTHTNALNVNAHFWMKYLLSQTKRLQMSDNISTLSKSQTSAIHYWRHLMKTFLEKWKLGYCNGSVRGKSNAISTPCVVMSFILNPLWSNIFNTITHLVPETNLSISYFHMW